MKEFLETSDCIDWQSAGVLKKASALAAGQSSDFEIARACFYFVRDAIKHSWDYKCNPVTLKASEVLNYGTGYCYAKSDLLAALLRANGIPAALCYQRLTITDRPPFCMHGLNAIYLHTLGWYRVDARGNKPGVAAEFMPPVEKLAYDLLSQGECDIAGFFSKPDDRIIKLLQTSNSIEQVYARLAECDFVAPH